MFTSSNLLVPAERSGCCIWDISGTWWHLAVGRQNWQGKAFCLNWCVTTESVDWSDMQNLSWAAFWAGASRLPRVTDATKRGLGPLRQRSWKGATQGSAEKMVGLRSLLPVGMIEGQKWFLIMQHTNLMYHLSTIARWFAFVIGWILSTSSWRHLVK